jgi:hypothetical protein
MRKKEEKEKKKKKRNVDMKQILTGNEASARGAYEAGLVFASAYPGTPSTEILENLAQYKNELYCEWAPNEKVALEAAIGASIAGVRSLAAMKHVGVNVAADPLFTFVYTGVNGGCVLVSADDPGMHSSQNEQDNRNYAIAAKILMLEPSDSGEAKQFTKLAFVLSERFDTPVLLRVTTRVCHSKSVVELEDRIAREPIPYERNIAKYVATPANGKKLRRNLVDRLKAMEEYSNSIEINRVEYNDSEIGVISAGVAYQYAKEVFGANASYLKLFKHSLLILRQITFERKIIRSMITPEYTLLLQVDVFKHQLSLLQHLLGREKLKSPRLDLFIYLCQRIYHQRQQPDVRRRHPADYLSCLHSMFLPIRPSSKAGNKRNRSTNISIFYFAHCLYQLIGSDTFINFLQYPVASGFSTDINHLEPLFAELNQLLVSFSQHILRRAVNADFLAFRKQFTNRIHDLYQGFIGQDQSVSVGRKNLFYISIMCSGPFQIFDYFCNRPDSKRLSLIHAAKCTPVMGTTQRNLQDQTVGFAGRSINTSLVSHWLTSFPVLQYPEATARF